MIEGHPLAKAPAFVLHQDPTEASVLFSPSAPPYHTVGGLSDWGGVQRGMGQPLPLSPQAKCFSAV